MSGVEGWRVGLHSRGLQTSSCVPLPVPHPEHQRRVGLCWPILVAITRKGSSPGCWARRPRNGRARRWPPRYTSSAAGYLRKVIDYIRRNAIVYFQILSDDGRDMWMTIWLTLQEAVNYLKMGKSTIYRLACEGNIPTHRASRIWSFDTAEVDEWKKQGRLFAVRDSKSTN